MASLLSKLKETWHIARHGRPSNYFGNRAVFYLFMGAISAVGAVATLLFRTNDYVLLGVTATATAFCYWAWLKCLAEAAWRHKVQTTLYPDDKPPSGT